MQLIFVLADDNELELPHVLLDIMLWLMLDMHSWLMLQAARVCHLLLLLWQCHCRARCGKLDVDARADCARGVLQKRTARRQRRGEAGQLMLRIQQRR